MTAFEQATEVIADQRAELATLREQVRVLREALQNTISELEDWDSGFTQPGEEFGFVVAARVALAATAPATE